MSYGYERTGASTQTPHVVASALLVWALGALR